MSHFASHALVRLAVYPAFYWIGLTLIKTLTFGRAIIIPYSELGMEEEAGWWEFRIRRWGCTEWRPESMIMIGGCFVLVVVTTYYVCRYLL